MKFHPGILFASRRPLQGIDCSLLVAIVGAAVPGTALAQAPVLVTTFTNPQPTVVEAFPTAIAAVGTDRVLMGAAYDRSPGSAVGRAYLFSTNATLLVTFTNFENTTWGYFGAAVATLGNDRLIIGAPGETIAGTLAGKVYLVQTNGSLLTTFANPDGDVPGDTFGQSVAALGNDRVLVGAPYGGWSDTDAARAFLFNTKGTLLATFTNPVPQLDSLFASSVAALGNSGVVIGAWLDNTGASHAGAAHLFSTNGRLITTFTNPTPAVDDHFGQLVVAFGSERVLISSPEDDTAGMNAGAAYLFSTNGALVSTFTNPAKAYNGFGSSMAPLGDDRVFIGASANSGIGYLFSTNGALLTPFTNPPPAGSLDSFGAPAAALGNDYLLIGATWKNSVRGVAYLFSVPSRPSLAIRLTATNTAVVSWRSAATGYVLQQNTALRSVSWSNVTATIRDDGTNSMLVVNPAERSRFYRLVHP
jgi:hypothetical protein